MIINNELKLYTEGTTYNMKDTDASIQAMNVENRFNDLLNQNIRKYDPQTAVAESLKKLQTGGCSYNCKCCT